MLRQTFVADGGKGILENGDGDNQNHGIKKYAKKNQRNEKNPFFHSRTSNRYPSLYTVLI